MKQEISALMDGELFDDEAEAVFDRLKRNPETHEEWLTYHLISDVLRQPDQIHANINIAIRERLRDEPTVLVPRSRFIHNTRWFALSAAASVMALTLTTIWLLVDNGLESPPQIARQGSSVLISSSQPVNGLDDYLMAHQEVSPSFDVYSMNSYVHAVAHEQGDK